MSRGAAVEGHRSCPSTMISGMLDHNDNFVGYSRHILLWYYRCGTTSGITFGIPFINLPSIHVCQNLYPTTNKHWSSFHGFPLIFFMFILFLNFKMCLLNLWIFTFVSLFGNFQTFLKISNRLKSLFYIK